MIDNHSAGASRQQRDFKDFEGNFERRRLRKDGEHFRSPCALACVLPPPTLFVSFSQRVASLQGFVSVSYLLKPKGRNSTAARGGGFLIGLR